MLSADDLLDPKGLDAKTMPVVVLPYGPVFPGEASDHWKRYLHEGGSFFSTGGYAFDEPVYKEDGKWLTWGQLIAKDPKWLKNGEFNGQDGWTVEGDNAAAHFGPDPNLGGKLGLVLGYPYETTYKNGGKQTSVTVRQTFAPPPTGRYEIHFMRYLRWMSGPGICSVTLTTFTLDCPTSPGCWINGTRFSKNAMAMPILCAPRGVPS